MNREDKKAIIEIVLFLITVSLCIVLGYLKGTNDAYKDMSNVEERCIVESEEAIQECKDRYYSNLEIVNTPQITYMVIGEKQNE